jgi:hypothetical protein
LAHIHKDIANLGSALGLGRSGPSTAVDSNHLPSLTP